MKRIFAIALVILLAACSTEKRVVIVSTNDIHSSIDGFPRLATLVEGLRASGEGEVLLVDAGDRWTGNPFVDLAGRPLSPIVELMNELGYDVATLGNHEFDWGQLLLRERLDEMDFPVVCANIESAGAELGAIPPYVFIEAGGVRFAFLGLVTNFSRWNRPVGKAEHFEGLTFPDVYETAKKYAALADSCDVFVGLVHLGHENEKTLVERVPAFDLVIGGDSHTVVETPEIIGNTLVTQAGGRLEYAGITTVTRKGGRRGVTTIENRLVLLDTIAPSPRYDSMVRRYNADPVLSAEIGRLPVALNENGVNNMVADAIRTAAKADIALYHAGGIRIDTLAAGPVRNADLYRIEPFQSEIYLLRMRFDEVQGLITNKFNDTINPKESHGPDLIPSGFTYTITTDGTGEAYRVIFRPTERPYYMVAMPDYVYKNYVFEHTGQPDLMMTPLVTRAMRDYITRSPQPDNSPRITIR